jgi:cytochrome P450
MTAIPDFPDRFLNTLVHDLYRRAAGEPLWQPIPIRVIDHPAVVQAIFRSPDRFIKNYGFLENFAKARFSSNGEEWRRRSQLTQPYYNRVAETIGAERLGDIYRNRLLQQDLTSSQAIFQALVSAAIEVISVGFGLDAPIPWPIDIVEAVRQALKLHQAMAWCPGNPALHAENVQRLTAGASQIRHLWQQREDMRRFLAHLEASAQGVEQFDAVQEMLQNLLAASETVASSLLWAVDRLGRSPGLQDALRQQPDQLDLFIKELLRLFPPVPMVTRIALPDATVGGMAFQHHEPVVISLVGLHCHRDYWQQPFEFQLPRPEFAQDRYERLAYIPFLSGPRVCGGMRLALAEMQAALLQVLDLFDVLPVVDPLGFEYGLASRPSARLGLQRRSS